MTVSNHCIINTFLLPLFKNWISPAPDRQVISLTIKKSPLSPQLNKLLTWVSLRTVLYYIQLCKVQKKPNIRPNKRAANIKTKTKNKSENIGWIAKTTINELITIASEIIYRKIKILFNSVNTLETKKISFRKL